MLADPYRSLVSGTEAYVRRLDKVCLIAAYRCRVLTIVKVEGEDTPA